MLLGVPGRRFARTENPRVGGSIPPLATIITWSVPDTSVADYSEDMSDTTEAVRCAFDAVALIVEEA